MMAQRDLGAVSVALARWEQAITGGQRCKPN